MSKGLMDWEEAQKAIKDAIAMFPPTFKLRAYPKDTFRMSESYSYMDRAKVNGEWQEWIMLYTEKLFPDGQWLSFAKGTVEELRQEIATESSDFYIERQ